MRPGAALAGWLGSLVVVAALGCSSSPNGGPATDGATPGSPPATDGSSARDGTAGVGGSAGSRAMVTPSEHRATSMVCSAAPADAALPGQGYDGSAGNPADAGEPAQSYDGSAGGSVSSDDGGFCSTPDTCPACANGLQRRCITGGGTLSHNFCGCDECNSDQDCSPTTVCNCGGTRGQQGSFGNQCIPANCRVDSDCGPGGFCSPSWFSYFGYMVIDGYYCHTPRDQCLNDADCPTGCSYYLPGGFWKCFVPGIAG
jgi:hypothetical protein